ncbi:MAG: 30S ribosomal protein S19e [Nitrososphaeria archaeon]|nr:30S ribosomal protein S19e [Conexivisphaerales archaeon]
MPTVYDVPADDLILELKEYLKKSGIIEPRSYFYYAKTGSQADRPPADPDWFYYRAASILRKLYIYGPISIKELTKIYGGRKAVGYSLTHSRPSGSSHIRSIIKDLEKAGLVAKTPKGRVLTEKGKSTLDKISTKIFEEFKKENPVVEKLGLR